MATKIGVVARAVVGRMTMTTGLGWSVAGVAIPSDLVSDDPKMAPLNDRWQGLAKKNGGPTDDNDQANGPEWASRGLRATGIQRSASAKGEPNPKPESLPQSGCYNKLVSCRIGRN